MTDVDRFVRTEKISARVRSRAQRLRATPTWTEAKLWERLRKLEIRIRRQAPIGPYVVDFACLRARLVIELDGGVHSRSDVALRDLRRDQWLNEEGYCVLRIDSARIPGDIDAVIAEITHAIRLKAPLPLEGEGAGGWGEAGPLQNLTLETPSHLPRLAAKPSAPTPTQPSPLEGEGS